MTDSETEGGPKTSTIGGFGETDHKSLSTRNQRIRYWSNNDELRLIELWRQHFNEINAYDKNEPVHRVISDAMKERRMNFNSQECRRRLNLLRNKYFAERKRLQLLKLPASESDWVMFPYIHCIYQPRVPNPDVMSEQKTLERVHLSLVTLRPSLKQFTPHKGYKRIQYEHDPKAFPFFDDDTDIVKQEPTSFYDLKTKGTRHTMPRPQRTTQAIKTELNTLQTPATTQVPFLQTRRSRRLRALPKHGHITVEHIERLRIENQLLSSQRDQQLKKLELKEEEINQLQLYFDQWEQQQNELLHTLKCRLEAV